MSCCIKLVEPLCNAFTLIAFLTSQSMFQSLINQSINHYKSSFMLRTTLKQSEGAVTVNLFVFHRILDNYDKLIGNCGRPFDWRRNRSQRRRITLPYCYVNPIIMSLNLTRKSIHRTYSDHSARIIVSLYV